jgi:hypothetical protein
MLIELRFYFLMAVSLKMVAFWNIAPCSLVEVDWRFRSAYCCYHQGDELLLSNSSVKFYETACCNNTYEYDCLLLFADLLHFNLELFIPRTLTTRWVWMFFHVLLYLRNSNSWIYVLFQSFLLSFSKKILHHCLYYLFWFKEVPIFYLCLF